MVKSDVTHHTCVLKNGKVLPYCECLGNNWPEKEVNNPFSDSILFTLSSKVTRIFILKQATERNYRSHSQSVPLLQHTSIWGLSPGAREIKTAPPLTLSYKFPGFLLSSSSLLSSTGGFSLFMSSPKQCSKTLEKAIADSMQTTGVRVSISRTITPAKQTALIAYRATATTGSLSTLRGKCSQETTC